VWNSCSPQASLEFMLIETGEGASPSSLDPLP